MDVHYIPGVAAMDVAVAHHKDMRLQEEYHCKVMTYWVDEARGNVFCLIDARRIGGRRDAPECTWLDPA